jgi:NADH-quinone oxidoreductase subunit G
MATPTINQKPISVSDGTTIIQAAEKLGIEIPRYCYTPVSVLRVLPDCLVKLRNAQLQPAVTPA